jgi:hypothetical protein
MSYSIVVRFVNQFNELLDSEIVDSPTKSGATRKANSLLKETFFVKVSESELDNYRYWRCQDIANLEAGK